MSFYKYLFFVAIGLVSYINIATASTNDICRDYYINYIDGLKIHLKEKVISSSNRSQHNVLILLNPLSIPALDAFDVPGYSVMDKFAKQGYDVWGVDFLGQGSSSYPTAMEESPAPTKIVPLQAKDALLQLNSAINYITKKTGNNSVSLLGWSWGSVVAAMYSIEHPRQVDHLVLYGAMYSFTLPKKYQYLFIHPYQASDGKFNTDLPAYQNIPWKMIEHHWKMMLNGNQTIVSESAFSSVEDIYSKVDPRPFIPGTLRRPIGPMKDLFSIWNNQPIYNINKLTVPTLVIYGNQDVFADHGLYSKLTNVKFKQHIVLKPATHWLIYERTREQFISQVSKFLAVKVSQAATTVP